MTYKAHIKSGVAVLDDNIKLPEGTEVAVIDVASLDKQVTMAELFKDIIGQGIDLPPDAARNKRHYLYGHPKS
jgi:hypothetical protein